MPKLQTERIEIVPFTRELIAAAMADRGALEGLLGAHLPAEWPGPDLADALPFFHQQLQAEPDLAEWMGLILHEGRLVGDIGFKGRPNEAGVVEIGYALIPSARGRGLATEAVRAMVTWARQQPGVQRITAETEPTNEPSMRVLERSGFTRSGEREGLITWVFGG